MTSASRATSPTPPSNSSPVHPHRSPASPHPLLSLSLSLSPGRLLLARRRAPRSRAARCRGYHLGDRRANAPVRHTHARAHTRTRAHAHTRTRTLALTARARAGLGGDCVLWESRHSSPSHRCAGRRRRRCPMRCSPSAARLPNSSSVSSAVMPMGGLQAGERGVTME